MQFYTVQIDLQTSTGTHTIRLTTAPFNIKDKDGAEFSAAGDLLKIGKVESSSEISTKGIEITLSGIDIGYQSIIEGNGFLKAPLDVMLVETYSSKDLGYAPNLIKAASYFHRGYCDTPTTTIDYKGESITISVNTESVFRDLEKTPSLMRCSFATHKSRHNGDLFFQYVQDTPTEEIWRT